jgi:hypothetical protein
MIRPIKAAAKPRPTKTGIAKVPSPKAPSSKATSAKPIRAKTLSSAAPKPVPEPEPRAALWNQDRRNLFLAELAASANVSASARAAGMKEAQAYAERRKSASFRGAWQEALSEGYAQLELMMLERAMQALRSKGGAPDPAKTRMEEYSNKLAMTLLAAHSAAVRGIKSASAKSVPHHPVDGVKARLSSRFDLMHQRLSADRNRDAA